MLPDPKMIWEDGPFPYDALAPAGVHSDSDMQQVKDAFYDLIEHGERSQETRIAWNALRNVNERLWVDFFLHWMSAGQIVDILQKHATKLGVSADGAEYEPGTNTESRMSPVLSEPLKDFDDQVQGLLNEIECEA